MGSLYQAKCGTDECLFSPQSDSTKEGKDGDPDVYLPKGPRTNNMRAFSTTYTILGTLPSSASEERKTTRTCSRQNTKITGTMKKKKDSDKESSTPMLEKSLFHPPDVARS